jgi:predicted DNA-binding transcriptional regulator AlpA
VSEDIYLTAKQVQARYGGISEMSLWRWVRDCMNGFPPPVYFGRKRFWLLRELEAWERGNARQKAAA